MVLTLLNYQPLRYPLSQESINYIITQCNGLLTPLRMLNYPFSVILFVPGKIYFVLRQLLDNYYYHYSLQLEIFRLLSRSETLRD